MSLQQFHSDFNTSVHKEDFERANDSLMRELGKILVRNKKDFVDMLNESSVSADLTDNDDKLIGLFIENAKGNKKLLLGASLLVNMHNQQMGFDGDDEISDESVKSSYIILNSYFNDEIPNEDEEQSNWVGKLVKGAKRFIDNRKNGGQGNDSSDWLARQQMSQAAYVEQQKAIELAKHKAEEDLRKKKRKNLIIGSSIGAVVLIAIVVIIVKTRKK